ncbi:CDP-alcohol phosphatidyltransferase family protein [Pseudarthrobacter sp. J75]|uniref:CDP-alcohol phosphatidyltransferase family protein n=1 Tax=unclassified Pseudarthrobacter TaxID=2647000 RepID=UPI002E7FB9FF|nr:MULTISPECIES: CDP-alcohol phosphatidyltransferase family protein [unclassified Pseudarthrobacter]MEE2521755.1 CDP-alcohol phosphatidyltransferase family protein [Pseudarthrobacter sp. J47]MEE2527832.1 CDP-alcohol phosphatidyltransferase family protein [Pseudarthrobacter sp. J75]
MRFIGAGSRPGHEQVDHDLVFTVPNILTVVRFLGVPLFMWLVLARQDYGLGVIVLVVMAGTDWVDGYIARRFDQASKLGRVLDPLADRLALITVAITLVVAGVIHWLYLLALLIPDAILLAMTLSFFRGHPDLPVSTVGKIRTGLLLAGTPLLLLSKLDGPAAGGFYVAAWIILGLGLVGHWIAAHNYFWAILRKGRQQGSGNTGRYPDAGSS